MKDVYFESAEFYHTRFGNFTTLLILPIFMLLILLVVILNTLNKIEIVNTPAIIENTVITSHYNISKNARINKLFVKEGDNVEKGEKLAVLDNQHIIYVRKKVIYI